MITWLQRFFDRHKYAVVVIFGLVIISFVFVINESGGLSRRDPRSQQRDYFGVDLSSAKQIIQLQRDVLLTLMLEGVDLARVTAQMVDPVWETQRLPFLYLANQLKLPGPDAREFNQFLARYPVFKGEDGNFSANAYTAFLDKVESDSQFSLEQLSRVLVEQYLIEEAEKVVFGNTYIPEFHREKFIEQQFTFWDLELASIDFSTFNPEIQVSDEDLEAFYRSNATRYEIPEKMAGYLVRFDPKRVEIPTDVSEKVLREYYEKNKERFASQPQEATAENEEQGKEPENARFENVKSEVLKKYRERAQQHRISVAAGDYVSYLYEAGSLPDFEELQAEAEKQSAEIISIAPFSNGEAPKEAAPLNAADLGRLFQTGNRYYTDPFLKEGNYYILIQTEVIPHRLPELSALRERVEKDYRNQERRKLFREEGSQLVDTLRKQVKEGEGFEKAAEALSFNVKKYENISFLDRSEEYPKEPGLDRELARLDKQDVSSFVLGSDRGYVIFVTDRRVRKEGEKEEDAYIRQILDRQIDYFYKQLLPTTVFRSFVEEHRGGGNLP